MDSPDDQPTVDTSLSIDQAAAALGVTAATIRRRIKRGELRATLVGGPHGPAYRIALDHPAHPTPIRVDMRADQQPTPDDQPDHASLDRLITLVDTLTTENKRLQEERFELAGRLGYLQAQNAELQERVKLLTAGPPAEASPTPPQSKRGWAWLPWRRRVRESV
jgi:excisionase family DNA binding protein